MAADTHNYFQVWDFNTMQCPATVRLLLTAMVTKWALLFADTGIEKESYNNNVDC
jgi:hypothetical protein